MTMGSKESFKEYAQKWRDLAGRVKPPLTDRELVDMFMSTLTGPFYSHLLRSSSLGFTELILTGEHVENGVRSGKIQAATSDPPETPNVIIAPLPNHDETVNAVEDSDSDCNLDSWIFPTVGDGLNNGKAEDTIPISFNFFAFKYCALYLSCHFSNKLCFLAHTHVTICRSISTPDLVDNNSAIVHYDFENPIYQAEDGSEEDWEVPGELARLLQEEETIQPHGASIEIVNLDHVARFNSHLTATCESISKLPRQNQEVSPRTSSSDATS
ncbi:hypothetical protein KIW84_032079 [Lathyrus oleraceus]|uniref:Uncharacterized protein n=1 Tax=Pisum sativum TaxID=3888 RepID=A0A9D5AW56_PEA|nr:hypothetical protein KIW84_032079 [Pisum sativum]